MEVDFKPGKLVCTGLIEGEQVVVEIIPEVVDGMGFFRILRFSADGVNLSVDDLVELNDEMEAQPYYPEDGYLMTSVIITEEEMIITSDLE